MNEPTTHVPPHLDKKLSLSLVLWTATIAFVDVMVRSMFVDGLLCSRMPGWALRDAGTKNEESCEVASFDLRVILDFSVFSLSVASRMFVHRILLYSIRASTYEK